MVIGGGAFAEMQKPGPAERVVTEPEHERAQVQKAIHERMLDDSMPVIEVKGFSGAGRAISSASRAASSAGRAAGEVGKAGKAAADVGKATANAGKVAGEAGATAGKVTTEAGRAAKDVPKTSVPSIDGRKQPDAPKANVPQKDAPGVSPASRAADNVPSRSTVCDVSWYINPTCIRYHIIGMGSGSSKARAESAKDCSKVDPNDKEKMAQCTTKEKTKR